VLDRLLDKFIQDKIKEMAVKDKLTGHIVKSKRRGAYQAFEESSDLETKIIENVTDYIHGWLLNEFIDGKLKDSISSEIFNAVYLELARLGYEQILKKKE
jgi:hypothetical protein